MSSWYNKLHNKLRIFIYAFIEPLSKTAFLSAAVETSSQQDASFLSSWMSGTNYEASETSSLAYLLPSYQMKGVQYY